MNERSIFLAAMAIDSATDRQAFLDSHCSTDAERERLESLLAAHDSASPMLDLPAFRSRRSLVQDRLGTTIGVYRLEEQIGEGGMGVVYRAIQSEPVQREVAIKIVKPGMDTHQVLARFDAERQALAMMDHPNIARIIEAGQTTDSYPYFVMDLVKGPRITHFCDEQLLTIRGRIQLFQQVCAAVQHAHVKGVLHRDLKPSNILVSQQQGEFCPQIIDFGLAKAMTVSPLTDTQVTQHFQLVGTPLYMSPEQLSGQSTADTRSDIYSLGIVLYELLSGCLPFERSEYLRLSPLEWSRLAVELEPPRCSCQFQVSQDASEIAAKRKSTSQTLVQELSADLDWIVAKALHSAPEMRYQTPEEFSDDLQRYLDSEPVCAAPPSLRYRLTKGFRRHRTAVVMSSAVICLLSVATVVSIFSAVQAIQAKRLAENLNQKATLARVEAQTQAERANAINAFLTSDLLRLSAGEIRAGTTFQLRELLDRAALGLEKRFANQPELELQIRVILARAYLQLSDADPAQVHLHRAQALANMQASISFAELLEIQVEQARVYLMHHRPELAERLLQQTMASADQLPSDSILASTAKHLLAQAHLDQQQFAEARQILEPLSLEFEQKLGASSPILYSCQTKLVVVYRELAMIEEAESLALKSVSQRIVDLETKYAEAVTPLRGILSVYHRSQQVHVGIEDFHQRFEEIETVANRQVISRLVLAASEELRGRHSEHSLWASLREAGQALRLGDFQQAAEQYRAIEIQASRSLGAGHDLRLHSATGLAHALASLGDHPAAQLQYRDALDLWLNHRGRFSKGYLDTLERSSRYLAGQQLFSEAANQIEEWLDCQSALVGETHESFLEAMRQQGNALIGSGQKEQGRRVLKDLLEKRKSNPSPRNQESILAWKAIAESFRQENRLASAVEAYRSMLALIDSSNPGSLMTPTRQELATLLQRQGRFDEAIQEFREVLKHIEGLRPSFLCETKIRLGECLFARHEYQSAMDILTAVEECLSSARHIHSLSAKEIDQMSQAEVAVATRNSWRELYAWTLQSLIKAGEAADAGDLQAWKQKLKEINGNSELNGESLSL